jgi:hypothetical protein
VPEPNADFLTRLGDMGFPEPVARRALLLTRNRLDAATEWCAGSTLPSAAVLRLTLTTHFLLPGVVCEILMQMPPTAGHDCLAAIGLAITLALASTVLRTDIAHARDSTRAAGA